jgi:hypothetical protein
VTDAECYPRATSWTVSDHRLSPVQRRNRAYPAWGHHLGRGPKHYRKSKTGRMLSDFPELVFLTTDNSGVHAEDVPAGTTDVGVFRCARCAHTFDAVVNNRTRQVLKWRALSGLSEISPPNRCAQCSGWTPKAGNSLQDLPPWLKSQLRVPADVDLSQIPLVGGTERKFEWECPAGHRFVERVTNRLRAHARQCATEQAHSCGCAACSKRRPTDSANFATAHPDLASRLDRMTVKNGYRAFEVACEGGRRRHWFWCGNDGHPPYYLTARSALRSRGLGCRACALS